MRIKKILNNNVIVSEDADGREIVAMGRGIAFGRRVGDEVAGGVLDKIYRLRDHELLEKFKELLSDLSSDYLEAANAIIEMAEQELDAKLNESCYITLTDHIHMAVLRIRNEVPIRNILLWEMRIFYPKEFAIAEKARLMLNRRFRVELPEDEAGFITMHLIDAQMDLKRPMAENIIKLIDDISNIVRLVCRIEFDRSSLDYFRYITHLKFFAKRMLGDTPPAGSNVDAEMVQMVRQRYPQAALCVDKITEFLNKRYYYELKADEQFYLMIHIAKLTSSNKA